MSPLSPDQFHPHLTNYRDGGMGGVGEDHSVVGYVKADTLAKMHGNATDAAGIERHRQALRSGEGFKNPVMVIFDGDTRRGYVGEGNHRVEAARAEGVSHVPVRVVRGRVDADRVRITKQKGGEVAKFDHIGRSPWSNEYDNYWPSDMHPAHVFKPEDVWHDRRGEK